MDIDPGLVVWTLINFGIFLAILIKIGAKPITKGLNSREQSIQDAIDNAEKANEQAKKFLEESEDKLSTAQKEMREIIDKGKEQAENIISKASEESEEVKKKKVEEAQREIEQSKNAAIDQLRKEVADLVVDATEKIIDEKLDKDKHYKIIEEHIKKLPKN